MARYGALGVFEKYRYDIDNGFKRVWYHEGRIYPVPGPWARTISDSITNTNDLALYAPQIDSLTRECRSRVVRSAIKKSLKDDVYDDYLQAELLLLAIDDDTTQFNYKGRTKLANDILCRLANIYAYCLIEMADAVRVVPGFHKKYAKRSFAAADFIRLANAAKRGFASLWAVRFAFLMPTFDSDGSLTLTTFFIIDHSFKTSLPRVVCLLFSLIFHMRLASRGIAPVTQTRPIYANLEMTRGQNETSVEDYMRLDENYTENDEESRLIHVARCQPTTRVEFKLLQIILSYPQLFQPFTAIHDDALESFNYAPSGMKYCILFGNSVRCEKKKKHQVDCSEEQIRDDELCCEWRHPSDDDFKLVEADADLANESRMESSALEVNDHVDGDRSDDKSPLKRVKLESVP
jgi:hypothetical protein